jgi:hypothetical protein
LDGIAKTNKKGYSDHFAEILYRVSWPYHSAKKAHLGIGKASLSSDVAEALGKEATFVECILMHSAKRLAMGPTGAPVAES